MKSGVLFGGSNITIGRGAFINCECFFVTYKHITIGSRAFIGMPVKFVSSSHEVGPSTKRAGESKER